jgi:hypothetical protein
MVGRGSWVATQEGVDEPNVRVEETARPDELGSLRSISTPETTSSRSSQSASAESFCRISFRASPSSCRKEPARARRDGVREMPPRC